MTIKQKHKDLKTKVIKTKQLKKLRDGNKDLRTLKKLKLKMKDKLRLSKKRMSL